MTHIDSSQMILLFIDVLTSLPALKSVTLNIKSFVSYALVKASNDSKCPNIELTLDKENQNKINKGRKAV